MGRAAGAALATVIVVYGAVAASLDPFTRPSEVAIGAGIVAVTVVAVGAGWHRVREIGPVPRIHGSAWGRGLAIWAVLIVAIGLFQMAQFQSNPRDVYPTLSSLASIAFGSWPVRAAAIAGWLALGLYIVGPKPRSRETAG